MPKTRSTSMFGSVLAVALASAFVTACSPETSWDSTAGSTSPMGNGFAPPAAAPPTALPPVAVDEWGRYQSPTRMALSRDGILYVSDNEAGIVVKQKLTGERVGAIGGFQKPLGVALFEPQSAVSTLCELCFAGPDGSKSPACARGRIGNAKPRFKACRAQRALGSRTYVGDEGDGSVRVVFNDHVVGALGTSAGEFGKPNSIATTSDGLVYVVDSNQHVIKVYDHEGRFDGAFGLPGDGVALQFPTDLAVNEAADELYVADFAAHHVVVLDLSGTFRRNLEAPPNPAGDPFFTRPAGLAVAPSGNLIVVDNTLAAVVVMTPNGALVDTIGYREGRYWTGDLALPIDAVSDGARVYVSSNRTGRIGAFEVHQ